MEEKMKISEAELEVLQVLWEGRGTPQNTGCLRPFGKQQMEIQHRRHTASAYGGKRRGCVGKEKPYHLLSPSLGAGSLSEGTDGNTH